MIFPFLDIILPLFLINVLHSNMNNVCSPNIKSSLEEFKHAFMTKVFGIFAHHFRNLLSFRSLTHPSNIFISKACLALIPLLVLNKNGHHISILGHNTTSVFDIVLHSNINNVCSPNIKSFLEEFKHAFMT